MGKWWDINGTIMKIVGFNHRQWGFQWEYLGLTANHGIYRIILQQTVPWISGLSMMFCSNWKATGNLESMNLICFPFWDSFSYFLILLLSSCYDAGYSELRHHSWSYQTNSLQILRLSRYRPSMDTNAKLIRWYASLVLKNASTVVPATVILLNGGRFYLFVLLLTSIEIAQWVSPLGFPLSVEALRGIIEENGEFSSKPCLITWKGIVPNEYCSSKWVLYHSKSVVAEGIYQLGGLHHYGDEKP